MKAGKQHGSVFWYVGGLSIKLRRRDATKGNAKLLENIVVNSINTFNIHVIFKRPADDGILQILHSGKGDQFPGFSRFLSGFIIKLDMTLEAFLSQP
jgi:hypothetical protein